MGKFADKNWTEIFNLRADATTKEIKMAYAALVKDYKPNKYPEEFLEINTAYKKAIKWVSDNPHSLSNIGNSNINVKEIKNSSNKETKNIDVRPNYEESSTVEEPTKVEMIVTKEQFYRSMRRQCYNNLEFDFEMLYSYLIKQEDMYGFLLEFYYLISPVYNANDIQYLFDRFIINDVSKYWKMLLASKSTSSELSQDKLLLESDLAKYNLCNNEEEFKKLVKQKELLCPYNFLSVGKVLDYIQRCPEVLKEYINMLGCKCFVYYDSPSTSLKILEILTPDQKQEYFIYMNAAYGYNVGKYSGYQKSYMDCVELLDPNLSVKFKDYANQELQEFGSLEMLALYNFKHLQTKNKEEKAKIQKYMTSDNSVTSPGSKVQTTKYKKSTLRKVIFAISILYFSFKYLIPSVVEDDNQPPKEVEKPIVEKNYSSSPNTSKTTEAPAVSTPTFLMCVEIVNQPFTLSTQVLNEDSSYEITITVKDDISTFDINNVYFNENPYTTYATSTTVTEDAGSVKYVITTNEEVKIQYIINGQVVIDCY